MIPCSMVVGSSVSRMSHDMPNRGYLPAGCARGGGLPGLTRRRRDEAETLSRVYFNTDVVPLLTRLGCNSGGCHGKATGQNGFKLSLLGFEPDLDYEAIVQEARGRRLFPAAPAQSLLLLKATGTSPTAAASGWKSAPRITRPSCAGSRTARPGRAPPTRCWNGSPSHPNAASSMPDVRQQPLRVTAHFSDGTTRDVTRQAVYQSNEPDIAEVNDAGVVQVKNRSGLFAVMVRYADQIAVFHGTVPHTQKRPAVAAVLDAWDKVERAFGTSTGICGASGSGWASCPRRRPTTANSSAGRRSTSAARCPRPTRWAYVSRHAARQAGPADRPPARPAGVRQLLRAASGATSCGTAAAATAPASSAPGTALFAGWIRDCLADNMPYDRFVSEILTAIGQPGNQSADGLVSDRAHHAGLRGIGGAGVSWHSHSVCPVPSPSGGALEPGRLLPAGGRLRPRRPQGRLRRRRGSHQRNDLSGRRGRSRASAHRAGDAAAAAGRAGLQARPLRRPAPQPGPVDDGARQPLFRPDHGEPHVGPFLRPRHHPPDRRCPQHEPAEQPRT